MHASKPGATPQRKHWRQIRQEQEAADGQSIYKLQAMLPAKSGLQRGYHYFRRVDTDKRYWRVAINPLKVDTPWLPLADDFEPHSFVFVMEGAWCDTPWDCLCHWS